MTGPVVPTEPPVRPLGAPTDLLRPTGRVAAAATRRPREDPAVRLGYRLGLLPLAVFAFAALAGGWSPWMTLAWLPRLAAAEGLPFVLAPVAVVLAVHGYAVGTKRIRMLTGFWLVLLLGGLAWFLASAVLLMVLGPVT